MRVLFVCVGNSARSQMAQGYYNFKAAKEEAISAGTKPAERVSSKAIQAMAEVGVDISKAKPKLLTPEMVEEAERIITMGCKVEESCVAFLLKERYKVVDWGLEDPVGRCIEDVRLIRDQIIVKVEQLLRGG